MLAPKVEAPKGDALAGGVVFVFDDGQVDVLDVLVASGAVKENLGACVEEACGAWEVMAPLSALSGGLKKEVAPKATFGF